MASLDTVEPFAFAKLSRRLRKLKLKRYVFIGAAKRCIDDDAEQLQKSKRSTTTFYAVRGVGVFLLEETAKNRSSGAGYRCFKDVLAANKFASS